MALLTILILKINPTDLLLKFSNRIDVDFDVNGGFGFVWTCYEENKGRGLDQVSIQAGGNKSCSMKSA